MRWLIVLLSMFLTTATAAGATIGTVTTLDGTGVIKREDDVVGDSAGTSIEQMSLVQLLARLRHGC